jgi:glucose/arabinose dehydrogenase
MRRSDAMNDTRFDVGLRLRLRSSALCLLVAVSTAACGGERAMPSAAESIGPSPSLPTPKKQWIPVVNIAPAVGWPAGVVPIAMPGLQVDAFATGLDHPRWLHVLPNGDVLVAETNAPSKPDDGKGLRGWFMGLVMKRAGAAVPSADRITVLRDTDGDGVADLRSVLIAGLNSPFGMALVNDILYVATSDAVLKFPYATGDLQIATAGAVVTALPAGPINHHWTKNLIASADGRTLYVTVGSNSNVGERGMEAEIARAAIWRVDIASGEHRIFASGLRNPNGMAWETDTGQLWTVVNERDEIGDDLVPDYMTSVREGGFYGWPYSYYGQHVDARVQPQRPDLVALAIAPDYALGSHTASLGLASSVGTSLPARFAHGMFIGQHGSWNRKNLAGYKVIFVPFEHGIPVGEPVDVLTGFVNAKGEAHGRPVGVTLDRKGALLVADDVGNAIWRVSATQ